MNEGMNSKFFYKIMAGFYDLLDVIYFRDEKNSPRTKVLEKIGEQDNVLDLCTGTGSCAVQIARAKPQTKITGIDLSKDMLYVARDKLKKFHIKNVKLHCMDATNTKFKDKCFDKILLSLVLHELEKDLAGQILKESVRILKDEGEILVTEWEPAKSLWRRILFFPIHILEPEPYRTFIRKDLRAYFRKFGLEIVETVHCDYTKVLRLKKM